MLLDSRATWCLFLVVLMGCGANSSSQGQTGGTHDAAGGNDGTAGSNGDGEGGEVDSTAPDAASEAGAGNEAGADGASGGPADGATGHEAGVVACPMPTGTAVTLTKAGGGYTVSNGLITLSIAGNGQVTQVAEGGKNLMAAGETMYVSESGGTTYYSINASSNTVVQQTAELVELSFIDTSGAPHDMDWDLHYVVRQGVSGFYYFLITQVGTATHPDPATLSELRTVQRFRRDRGLRTATSGERHGLLPHARAQLHRGHHGPERDVPPDDGAPTPSRPSRRCPGSWVRTTMEGPVYTKYDWASYRTEDTLHGLYGNGYGVWILSPSWEFYTGAALKQELMVQDGTT